MKTPTRTDNNSSGVVDKISFPVASKKAATIASLLSSSHESVPSKHNPELIEQALAAVKASLEEDKAEDIVTLDLRGRANFTDYMVIATGLVDRQIAAMAHHIGDKLKELGLNRIAIEGADGTEWVLLDAGDLVVHLFKPESRSHYALERMWAADFDEAMAEDVVVVDI